MEQKMTEIRNSGGNCRDMVCIDTYRVLDSCRDKDCFEDVRVFLTERGQEIIERTGAVRAKSAEVVFANIDIDNVPFNKGFYQLYLRIYTKILLEACLGPGNLQEFEGIAAVDKKVILYGGEGNVSIFKNGMSDKGGGFCGICGADKGSSLPIAVLETVDPIVLGTKIAEPGRPCRCTCCSAVDEIPDNVFARVNGGLVDCPGAYKLLVSLGLFSVVRIERPAQYLVNAVEYCVPEKECVMPPVDDPCSLFKQMTFPTAEFCPPPFSPGKYPSGCGCQKNDECGSCK